MATMQIGTAIPGQAGTEAPEGRDRSVFQGRARVTLGLVLLGLGIWTLHNFLPALVWATILAIALWPLYRRCEARFPPGRHNIVLPLLFTLAVALVVVVPLGLAAAQLAHESRGIFHFFEEARKNGIPVPEAVAKLPVGADQVRGWWETNLKDPSGYGELLERFNRGTVLAYSREIGAQVLRRSVLFGFTLLALFFLFRDGAALVAQMRRAGGRAVGPHGERVAQQMAASVHGTVDGLVLVGLGEGVILGIAYWITAVPHPTIFGALTAVAAMIPFAAAFVIAIPVLLLLAAGSTVAAIVVAALAAIVIFAADHFVRPVLIGGATKLPFLWVLLGILGGVETWGLLGLFLGPALMAALIQLWRDWGKPTDTSAIVAP